MPTPYPLLTNNPISFEFITDQQVGYAVYFLDCEYLFADFPHISSSIYSFNIDVRSGDVANAGEDDRIAATIMHIMQLFFVSKQNVALYVCDTSDGRQLARHRKFSLWFWRYNDGSIIKEDGVAGTDDQTFYNSILVHTSNPECQDILQAFNQLNEDMDQKE